MIVYLHGFNSGGTSGKAAWLRQHLPDITVLSPTYPVQLADAAPTFLRNYLARARQEQPPDKRLLLIGSSLGGLWARYLAPELGAGIVLINPAMHPETDLLSAVGPNKNEATDEEYILTDAQVKALARYQMSMCHPNVPTLVLLDEADELLDYREAQSFYRDCGQVIVYPGGSHRFDHLPDALPEIRRLHDNL
ncbi:MAG: hypothetical protein HY308_01615 [Gammaproteobacteria bacterium]|nr:hypothetical protein [Gammaproteobacteria bacterium]